jgi:hypothetical protein
MPDQRIEPGVFGNDVKEPDASCAAHVQASLGKEEAQYETKG